MDTVYLEEDLDFTDFGTLVAPIGHHDTYNNDYFFKGIFDGQGHTISNLKITTKEEAT